MLGVRAARGTRVRRVGGPRGGAAPVIVISYGYWTRRFHNDPSVIGRAIVINDIKITIVGVAPPSFTGEIVGVSNDIWLPIAMQDALHPNQRLLNDRNPRAGSSLLGRLAPGATCAGEHQDSRRSSNSRSSTMHRAAGRPEFLASTPKYYFSSGGAGFSRVRATFQRRCSHS